MHTHVGLGVRHLHLLTGWKFCAHDPVLLPFLLAHALSVNGYEVEAPTPILDIIHQLQGEQETSEGLMVCACTYIHMCTHTQMHIHMHVSWHTCIPGYM